MRRSIEIKMLKDMPKTRAPLSHTHTVSEVGLPNVKDVSLNWSWGTSAITHIWGSQGDATQSYVYNGTQLKAFVGLANVNNWGATAAINDSSDITYATAGAVKKAYDLASVHKHSVADVTTTGITTAKFIFAGGLGVEYSQAAIEIREVGQVGKTKSTYDYAPSIGFHWAMTTAGSLALHADGNFYLRGQGFTGTQYRSLTASNFFVGTNPVYHAGNKPTASDIGALPLIGKAVDSALLNGTNETTASTINTIAKRDGSGDISVRLLRSEYANQNTIGGAIAYRTNNVADNYVRFCSDPAAIRTWLGTAATFHNHTALTGVTDITGAGSSGTWGSLNIGGVKASWAGINFTGVGHTFMVDANGQAGVWQSTGACKWYFDSTGTLAVGKVGWDKITNVPSKLLSDNLPLYAPTKGILITTDIPSNVTTMVELRLSGNSYSLLDPIDTFINLYAYSTNGIISSSANAYGKSFNVLAFYHEGFLKLWFPNISSYQTYRVDIKTQNLTKTYSAVLSDEIQPTGYTNLVTIIPRHYYHSGNFNPDNYLPKTGGNIAGTLRVDSLTINGFSSCGIYAGNADNALYDAYNLKIKSWWGIGFESYDGINRIVMDTRNGNISTIGSIYIGNGKIPMCINASSYDFSGGMWGQMTIGATMCAGTITTTGVATMSDKRVKENIIYLNTEENELYDFFLNDFKPATFNYIHDESKQIQYGFIAQDLVDNKIGELILSTPTSTDEKGIELLTFNQSSYTTAIAIALKEALVLIEDLKVKNESIELRLAKLENTI